MHLCSLVLILPLCALPVLPIRLIQTMRLMLAATPGQGGLVGGTLLAWVEGEGPIVWMLDMQCTKCLMLRRMLSLMR